MIHIDCYRIATDRWGRRWQAEWDGCQLAPRAWTEAGVFRKAVRWAVWGIDVRKALARAKPTQGDKE